MKITTRTTLILASVLILGIIIGFIGASSWLRYNQRKRIGHFREGGGFIVEMEKLIDPHPDQKELIHQILVRHSLLVKQFSEEQRTLFMKSIDSLNTELAQILSPEQMTNFQHKIKNRPKRPGPHPGPPPPPGAVPHP
jgi:hypothetical protein